MALRAKQQNLILELNFQLSYNVDEKKLREVFRLAGRCVTIELGRDKEGKSRGHAIIEFDHPVEAVQAISMFNNQMVSIGMFSSNVVQMYLTCMLRI